MIRTGKNAAAVVIAALLGACAMVVACAAAEDGAKAPAAVGIANGGFESGDAEPVGWSFAHNEGGQGRWEWSDAAHAGRRAVRIVKTNAAGYSTVVSDFIPVTAGRHYELSAQARLNGGGASRAAVSFMVSEYADGAAEPLLPNHFGEARRLPPGEAWTRISLTFPVRQGTSRVKVQALVTAAPIDVLLDDFELREAAPADAAYKPRFERAAPEPLPPPEPALERLRRREPALAERRVVDGRVRFFLDGRPAELSLHVTPFPHPADAHVADFRRAGVKLHLVPLVLGRRVYGDFGPWLGKDAFDWAEVDERLMRILRVDPDAYVMFYLATDPYPKWGEEHPDSVVRDQHGRKVVVRMHPSGWGRDPDPDENGYRERWGPSYVSADLRRDTQDALRQLVRHVQSSLPGKAVAGYHIGGGGDVQFFHWAGFAPGTTEPGAANYHLADYSPAAQDAFRDWLRRKYGSDAALRAAWNRAGVTLDAATIPSGERRLARGFFFDATTDEDIADYNRFYSEGVAETIHGYARVIKQEAGGRKLVSTYWEDAAANVDSHFATARMLQSPDIDFLAGPTDYGVRMPGEVGAAHSVWGSLMLHDRAWVSEQDFRSWFSEPLNPTTDHDVGRATSAADHNNMVRRDSGMMLAFGQGAWWYEMAGGWFADAGIMAGVAEARAAFARDLATRGRPRADVAVFISERSLDYLKFEPGSLNYFRHAATVRQIRELNRSGVPYRVFLQSDLDHPALPDATLYLFLNAHCIEPGEWSAIQKLKRDGKTLCFVHAPGVIKPGNVGAATPAEAIERVTGIRVRELGGDVPMGVLAPPESPDAKPPFPLAGMEMSVWSGRGPAFAVDDPRATPLGVFDDATTAAAAWRDFGDWRGVFFGGIGLSDALLHALARHSGAWVAAAPGDATFANQHFFTIHALYDSEKTLHFPQRSRVIDLTSGETLAASADTLKIHMKRGETRWFQLQPAE